MGYDIHITRRETWFGDGEPSITREEWRAILASDPDLEDFGNDTALMWDSSRQISLVFWYCDGKITFKKPNKIVLMKMIAMAEQLGARVIGDDDEVYSKEGIPDRPAQFTPPEDWYSPRSS